MRDILFKAKRLDNGEWIEGYYIKCDERHFICAMPECDTSKYMLDGYWLGTFYEVLSESICQYTGLTDKNGKKIWEKDVVVCVYDGCANTRVIVWDESE